MKKKFVCFLTLVVLVFVNSSCEDNFSYEELDRPIVWEKIPENQLNSVKGWYQSVRSPDADFEVVWGTARYYKVNDNNFIASVFVLGEDVKVLKTMYIHKSDDGFNSYIIGVKPEEDDTSEKEFGLSENFSGEVSLFDLEDNMKTSSFFEEGKVVRVKSGKDKSVTSNMRTTYEDDAIILNEIVITGARIENNLVWIAFNTPLFYDLSSLFPGYRYEGYSGGGHNYSAPISDASESPLGSPPPPPPIEPDCIRSSFMEDSKPFARHEITIYVDQPKEGTREAWAIQGDDGDKLTAGHAFVKLTRIHTDGTKMEYVAGFYPMNQNVNPLTGDVTDNGGFRNNKSSSFDVSIKWSLSLFQFNNVLEYLVDKSEATYNLNSQNCSDIALGCATRAGRTLPDTQGTWTRGGGTNPADLGEDIRAMPNSSSYTINKTGGTATASPTSNPC